MSKAEIVLSVVFSLFAYLLGSVNFAVIFSKIKNMDIKRQGSGNPGTMNVLRTVGKTWGILTFICDALKGLVLSLLGLLVLKSEAWLFILGFITILGHMFPIFDKFKGGKGVATSIGIFLVACPLVAVVVLACLIVMLYVFKYGFLGSILSISVLAVYTTIKYIIIPSYILTGQELILTLVFLWLIWLFVVIRHYGNFSRLFKGKENTLQLGKKEKDTQKNA